MNLLVPAALGFAALAGPLLVLYMLRSRRRQVDISSTRIWQSTEMQVTSALPWSPLKWSVLLLLQLAIVGLFAFTLSRPYLAQRTLLGPHSVFIIDSSGSMAEGDRFLEAKARAVALTEDVSEGNLLSVVDAGPRPQVVLSQARSGEDARKAIEALEVGGGEADLSDAIRLGRGLATPDRPTNLIIFSDGGESPLPEEPVLGASHIPLREIVDDIAVEALSIETIGGVSRGLVAVANHGSSTASVDLQVAVNDVPTADLTLEITPHQRIVDTFELDAVDGDEIMVRRVGEPDGNPLDDRAVTVIRSAAARTVSIRGTGSPFLQALVAATPGFELAEDDADVLVVDRGPLPEIDRPALVIRTDSLPEGLELTGLVENVPATFQAPGEPVLDNVDLSELVVAEAQALRVIGWSPIVRSGDLPLVLLGSVNGHRVAYLTFDLTHSNLPVQVSFPILGSALLAWLGGDAPGTVSTAPAGEPIPIASPDGAVAVLELPDGSLRMLASDVASFNDTAQPGIYRVTYRGDDGTETSGGVEVRTFVATEAGAPVRAIATSEVPGASQEPAFVVREWTAWLTALLVLLLAIEWWLGHQRPWRGRTA